MAYAVWWANEASMYLSLIHCCSYSCGSAAECLHKQSCSCAMQRCIAVYRMLTGPSCGIVCLVCKRFKPLVTTQHRQAVQLCCSGQRVWLACICCCHDPGNPDSPQCCCCWPSFAEPYWEPFPAGGPTAAAAAGGLAPQHKYSCWAALSSGELLDLHCAADFMLSLLALYFPHCCHDKAINGCFSSICPAYVDVSA